MKSMGDLKSFDAIKIYIASSEEILSWSHGEVTKPETINYRTFKAEREGLFDERIFGPVKNFECYCGKYKGIRYKGVICDKCGVEVTHSRVRRERMGHIKLASPAAHVWFFKGIPSKMAILLGITPRSLDSVIYFSSYIVTDVDTEGRAKAIEGIDKDLEGSQEKIRKEIEKEVVVLEKQLQTLSKEKDELKAQEEVIKVNQKIQVIKNGLEERLDDNEKNFRALQKKVEGIDKLSIIPDSEYPVFSKYIDSFCKLGIGAEAVQKILADMDLNSLSLELREAVENSKGQKAAKFEKRLKAVEQFRKSNQNPDRMVLEAIPVIPPDLRPLVQLEGGRFASSDLNELYRSLINRNNRLKRLLDLGAPEIIIRNEKRMLQESVDALFDSSKQRLKNVNRRGNKKLRSLADMLKGKTGIFRLNLLGKRVDYSGRAVIINGPHLKLNECGLPKEMALELFKPFVLRELMMRGYAPNIKNARYVLDERGPEVWDILEELVEDHPVLLNRAPTLWRLGIQAFYPKLIDGNAVRLHLAVCAGYNADFDGDQMAVHLPLSEEAITEAKNILISSRNLLNPSNGTPMSVPSKTMLFGIYYMTTFDVKKPILEKVIYDKEELVYLYSVGQIALRQQVKVRVDGQVMETSCGRILFNEILPKNFGFINEAVDKGKVNDMLAEAFENEEREVVVKLIDDIKDLGLKFGTLSGNSVSTFDIGIPANREELIRKGKDAIKEVDKNFKRGLITAAEAKRIKQETWIEATNEIDNSVWDNLEEDNPMKIMVKSKATRASRDQLKQIAGIKGLVTDATGSVIPVPILGNYRTGLSGLEYFISSRGARKTLIDKGLKTADAGYLTRRLVDVAQDVLVREEDCGSTVGREVAVADDEAVLQTFEDKVVGRYLLNHVKVKNKIIAKKNTLLTTKDVKAIRKAGIKSIVIRSPLNCQTQRGICKKCYGTDLITRELVDFGAAVGVAAAQSIGEPGTQLTMRTFHTGGVVGKDITQGLPRVEELVEARTPKNLAVMSELSGTTKVVKNGDERKVMVFASDRSAEPSVVEYNIDPVAEILVKDDQIVAKGEKLTSGHLDLTDYKQVVGIEATKKYIIDEVQRVYGSQGVALNDKHIEVIVRQMFNYVRIVDAGDTSFSSGDLVSKASFEEENEKVLSEGGMPATAEAILLGITKAALFSDSFLSGASFQNTSSVLTDASASGKVDMLLGLKENVIIGNLIPTSDKAQLK